MWASGDGVDVCRVSMRGNPRDQPERDTAYRLKRIKKEKDCDEKDQINLTKPAC